MNARKSAFKIPRAYSITLAGLLSLDIINTHAGESLQGGAGKVDFNREIRPILSENCYKCHGPDDGARKSNLRFDVRAEALHPAKSGRTPIVPGSPEKSEMVARTSARDPEKRMPLVSTGKKLTP